MDWMYRRGRQNDSTLWKTIHATTTMLATFGGQCQSFWQKVGPILTAWAHHGRRMWATMMTQLGLESLTFTSGVVARSVDTTLGCLSWSTSLGLELILVSDDCCPPHEFPTHASCWVYDVKEIWGVVSDHSLPHISADHLTFLCFSSFTWRRVHHSGTSSALCRSSEYGLKTLWWQQWWLILD